MKSPREKCIWRRARHPSSIRRAYKTHARAQKTAWLPRRTRDVLMTVTSAKRFGASWNILLAVTKLVTAFPITTDLCKQVQYPIISLATSPLIWHSHIC